MASLADIRAQANGAYDDLSDDELATRVHAKFYNDMPFDDFKARLTPGYAVAKKEADSTILDPRVGQLAQGASLGFADELDAATAAGLKGVENFGKTVTGQPVTVKMGDTFRATLDADREQAQKWAKDHPPVLGIVEPWQVAGGFALPFGNIYQGMKMLPGFLSSPVMRSLILGAGTGAATAAGTTEGDAGDRLAAVPGGAGVGAFTAGALHTGGKILSSGPLQRIGGAVSEALSRFASDLGYEPGAPLSPAQAARGKKQGTEAVMQMAKRIDPTGEKLAANPMEQRGAPITAAEALGREAETQLKVTGRRSGATPDALESMMRERAAETPGRVVDDFAEMTGINPAEIDGDFAAQAARLRGLAAPLYEEAHSFDGPVISDRLTELMKRPSISAAKRRAFDIIEEEGGNPEDMGFFRMPNGEVGVRGGAKSAHAFPYDEAETIAREIEYSRSAAYGKGENGLADWVVSKGGIKDDRGDAMAIIGKRGEYPGLLPANGGRRTIDQLITAAVEDGKFPGFRPDGPQPTRTQFLDALDADIRRGSADPEAVNARDVLNYWERHGVDVTRRGQSLRDHLSGSPDAQGDGVPTMRAWDYIKRGLDDVLEGYRDGTTRKLNLDTKGRAIVSTLNQLRDELTNEATPWGPAYKAALDAGGEPIRLESAFRDAEKLMSNTVKLKDFSDRVGKLTPSQLDALRAGIVADARDRASSGKVRLNNLLTKSYEQKLVAAFGPDVGRSIIQRIHDERFLLTHGQRMTPGIGADTSETLIAEKEMDESVRSATRAITHATQGKPLAAIFDLVMDPVAGLLRGAQVPMGRAQRDAMGELLMLPPSQLHAELKAYAADRGKTYLTDSEVDKFIAAMKQTMAANAKGTMAEQAVAPPPY